MSQLKELLSNLSLAQLGESIQKSQLYRSLFRVGVPTSDRKRMLVMLGNVFLHLHPVKVRKQNSNPLQRLQSTERGLPLQHC